MARTRVVSWLRAASTHLPDLLLEVSGVTSLRCARYSGGAAPASHRFPWLPSAINCLAKLAAPKRPRKRDNHRTAENKSNRDENAWIDRPALWRRGEIYHRH